MCVFVCVCVCVCVCRYQRTEESYIYPYKLIRLTSKFIKFRVIKVQCAECMEHCIYVLLLETMCVCMCVCVCDLR